MGLVRVLINDEVKRHLLQAGASERRQIRKSFEYLESGLWEGGLRIKRLQGVSRAVLEARLSRSERLLFTLAREIEEPRALLVHVWAVVPHDDVERRARAIDSDAAPFLSFDAREILEASDVDMETLGDSIITTDRSGERQWTDSAPQRWFVLDDSEWQRLLIYSKDDFEIFLYLTPEQRALLEKDPPLLVSGTAGSGKTTLSVYYLLRHQLQDRSCLFLTYNRHLRNFCQRLYAGLINQRSRRPLHEAQFRTFKELCLQIVGKEAARFAPEREVDAFSFYGLLRRHRLSDRFDSAVVWEEIRSIIKGAKPQITATVLRGILKEWSVPAQDTERVRLLREELLSLQQLSVREKAGSVLQRVVGCTLGECIRELEDVLQQSNQALLRALETIASEVEKHEADFSAPLMTLAEYEQIGHKRAPAFVHNRSEIYSIAQWYQSQIEQEQRWDEIDLTRAAIRAMDRAPAAVPRYDFVCCDEIQDFTGIQLSLLVRLPRRPEMLMLSGDPKQIINPSGFRWEEARGLFYERRLPVPEVHFLSLNFRCVGSIVALSNVLLQIKQDLLGVRSDERPDESRFQGQPPFLVENVASDVLLRSLRVTGADRMILTRDEDERDRLQRELETELVFTIEEAKGLEFRSVVLWKFCREGAVQDLWGRILRAETARVHDAAIRHELNLLYVGITRAQRNLILYDGEQSSILWRDPRIEELVFRTQSSEHLDRVWSSISTPEEWSKQGDYFQEHEHYRAAAECYRNAGEIQKMQRARAAAAEKRAEWSAAAGFWEQAGDLDRAAEAWERAGEIRQALTVWELLGRESRALPCRIRLMEQEKRYAEAAQLWEQIEQWDSAIKNWQMAQRPDRLALLYERAGKWVDAAYCYRDSRQWLKAAQLFAKSRRWEDAARGYESAGMDAEALKLWRKLKRDFEELACLQRMHDYAGLADFHERRGQWKKAMEMLSKAYGSHLHETVEQQLAAMKSGKPGTLAVRLTLLGRSAEAASLWERIREFSLAAEGYRAAGNTGMAARTLVRAERWADALQLLAESEDSNELRRISERWIQRDAQAAVPVVCSIAGELSQRGKHLPAAELFVAANKILKAAECTAAAGNREIAIALLHTEKDVRSVVDFLVEQKWWVDGAEMLKRLGSLRRASGSSAWKPLDAFLQSWKAAGVQQQDHPAFLATVREHAPTLNILFVISVLEEEKLYDELMQNLQEFLRSAAKEQDVLVSWVREAKQKESAGDMAGAGARYMLLADSESALRCWSRVEATDFNLICLQQAGFPDRVIDFLEKDDPFEAAMIAVRHKRFSRAAELFMKTPYVDRGAPILESERQFAEAAVLYQAAGDYRRAGLMFEKVRDFAGAAKAWGLAGDTVRKQRCLSRVKPKSSAKKKTSRPISRRAR